MATKVRVFLSAVLVLTAMWLVDCGHYTCGTTFGSGSCTSGGSGGIGQGGGGTNIQNPAAFDYFFEAGNLNAAFLNTSNNFNLIPNFASPSLGLVATDGMVVVQKKWLYIDEGVKVAAFSINGGTGALTALTGSPFPASSTESAGMTADPAGKFLFLSAANDGQVVVFAINQTDGTLTSVGSFPTGSFAGEATTDGLGKYLYVTESNLGTEVFVYAIGATGALTPLAGSPFSISIAQLRGEPTGKFLLGITGNGVNNGFGTDNHIYVYSIDQTTGAPTAVTGSPFATVYIPGNLEVHPSGKYVYTFNGTVSGTSPAEGYQFDTTTGAVTPVVGSPFTAVTASDGQFDQSGTFLFTHPSTTLAVFSVSSTTGALASIAPPITGIGNPSEFVVTDP